MTNKEITQKLDKVNEQDIYDRVKEIVGNDKTIVIAYPCSDDLIEFEGGIWEELYVGEEDVIHLDSNGLLKRKCEHEGCPYENERLSSPFYIRVFWCPEGSNQAWVYETNIPNAEKFSIINKESGDVFGDGIVFTMDDLKQSVLDPKDGECLRILDEEGYVGDHEEYQRTTDPLVLYDWTSEEFMVDLLDGTSAMTYGKNRGMWARRIADLARSFNKEKVQ